MERNGLRGALAVLLLGVVAVVVYAATNLPPTSYIIEDMGYKKVYSVSPSSSEIVVRTIWTVKASGGKLAECIFVGENKEGCFKEAVRKIMLTEGVNTVEVTHQEDNKYRASPIRESK